MIPTRLLVVRAANDAASTGTERGLVVGCDGMDRPKASDVGMARGKSPFLGEDASLLAPATHSNGKTIPTTAPTRNMSDRRCMGSVNASSKDRSPGAARSADARAAGVYSVRRPDSSSVRGIG